MIQSNEITFKKKYLNLEDFVSFLNRLRENESQKVYTEYFDGSTVDSYYFMKMSFAGSTIILYETPNAAAGIIQDTPVAPWEDYAEGVFEDFMMDGEFKVFIEDK